LDARFELREVQEVTPIYRQVFDLSGCQNPLNGCLLGVDLKLIRLDLNHSALLADFQFDGPVGRIVDLNFQG